MPVSGHRLLRLLWASEPILLRKSLWRSHTARPSLSRRRTRSASTTFGFGPRRLEPGSTRPIRLRVLSSAPTRLRNSRTRLNRRDRSNRSGCFSLISKATRSSPSVGANRFLLLRRRRKSSAVARSFPVADVLRFGLFLVRFRIVRFRFGPGCSRGFFLSWSSYNPRRTAPMLCGPWHRTCNAESPYTPAKKQRPLES